MDRRGGPTKKVGNNQKIAILQDKLKEKPTHHNNNEKAHKDDYIENIQSIQTIQKQISTDSYGQAQNYNEQPRER